MLILVSMELPDYNYAAAKLLTGKYVILILARTVTDKKCRTDFLSVTDQIWVRRLWQAH